MKKKLTVLAAMLVMVLTTVSPALAMHPVERVDATGGIGEISDHSYATHGIRDETSGAEYLLWSDTVDLDAYNGKRATIHGTVSQTAPPEQMQPASGNEEAGNAQYGGEKDRANTSQPEDGREVVNVSRIEPARYMGDPTPCDEYLPSGDPNPDYDPNATECSTTEPPGETVEVTFELTIDGEVPEGSVLGVDTGLMDAAQPVFCSTTTYGSGLPRCEDGATYSDTFETSAGNLSYEYTVFDQNCGGVVETFAADTKEFTKDETVNATYKPGDPGNNVEIVEATGALEKPEVTNYMYGTHAIADETSGEYYALKSSIVDLDAFVDRRVTLYGYLVDGYENGQIEGGPPLLDVYQVEPASGPGHDTVTATFELTVEGEPPAGTGFFGRVGSDGGTDASGALLEGDGDGVYTTNLPVERGAEREVRIERADPLAPDDPRSPLVPSTIKNFGEVTFDEDETFSTTISFEDDGDDNGGSGNNGSDGGRFLSNAASGIRGLLPSTGGGAALATLGAGVLLVSGGLLLRKTL